MEIVKGVRVKHVSLQEVTPTLLLGQLTDFTLNPFWVFNPLKPTGGKEPAHCPTVQVVGIQVLKVATLLSRIKPIIHVLVVRTCVSMNGISDTASCTSLEHEQHVGVGKELQVSISFLNPISAGGESTPLSGFPSITQKREKI